MKTLFDTSVILDARDPSSAWHGWAVNALANAIGSGGAVVNPVVLAEVSVRAPEKAAVRRELESWGIEVVDLPKEAAEPAAAAFAVYLDRLKREGKTGPRTPLPDFFIGGHALASGYPLATRDTARIRTYFAPVALIQPAAATG
jgi:predicted nucleic acid-binding protein